VVIDWGDTNVAAALPDEAAISAITLAELAVGPHLAPNLVESARRQARLQQVEATFEPIAFDGAAARSYGQIVAAIAEHGRSHRRRIADLLIAATAHANGLALYTRNPDDFAGLEGLIALVGL
jgi:predicted nucleic acid-binding protein